MKTYDALAPELPDWASKFNALGPFGDSELKWTNRHKVVRLNQEPCAHEALTGWGKLMYLLTDDVVKHYRTDMVHDTVAVSDMIRRVTYSPRHDDDGFPSFARVLGPIEFVYAMRTTGTDILKLELFDSAEEFDRFVGSTLGVEWSRSSSLWMVGLSQVMSPVEDDPEKPGDWVWLAEEISFKGPK